MVIKPIRSLSLIDALNKARNVRAVVIRELKRMSETECFENKCVLLAAADLLSEQK